jgi:adenylate cyclase
MTDKISAAMQIAERIYSLAQEQDDPALMIGAYSGLACTHFFRGDFESTRQHARQGVQIWRSGGVQSYAEDVDTPVVSCLCYGAHSEWHLGEIASCRTAMAEAISLAKDLKDRNTLALALNWALNLAYSERNPAEVDRLASQMIELSTRHHFVYWLALGAIARGWARSASGDTAEGITWIEHGIRDFRATGSVLGLPGYLARKAEALHLADCTAEALVALNEAQAVAQRFEQRSNLSALHQLRAVFLATLGAEETQIEASFSTAIRIAKEQKSGSLQKRAEGIYAEYCRQKASALGGRGIRLPLW